MSSLVTGPLLLYITRVFRCFVFSMSVVFGFVLQFIFITSIISLFCFFNERCVRFCSTIYFYHIHYCLAASNVSVISYFQNSYAILVIVNLSISAK